MLAKRTEPSRKALDPRSGFKYVNSDHTDLAKRFKAIAAEQKKAARQAAQKESASRQISMDLEGGENVVPMHRAAGGM